MGTTQPGMLLNPLSVWCSEKEKRFFGATLGFWIGRRRQTFSGYAVARKLLRESSGPVLIGLSVLLEKPQRWVLYSVSTTTGGLRELYSSNDEIGRPVWISGGRDLLMPHYDPGLHRTQLWTVSLPLGETRPFTNDLSDYGLDLDITRDGQTSATNKPEVVKPAIHVSAKSSQFSWICGSATLETNARD